MRNTLLAACMTDEPEEGRSSIVVDSVRLLCALCEVLSDERFAMPDKIDTSTLEGVESVGFSKAVQMVRDMVERQYAEALETMESEYEYDADQFKPGGYYKHVPVKDGKVMDGWGHTSKAQVDWFLANVTIGDMFEFRRLLHKAARLTVRDNLMDYARGVYEDDPRKSVKQTFDLIAGRIYAVANAAVA